jgi:hypothetical protein
LDSCEFELVGNAPYGLTHLFCEEQHPLSFRVAGRRESGGFLPPLRTGLAIRNVGDDAASGICDRRGNDGRGFLISIPDPTPRLRLSHAGL